MDWFSLVAPFLNERAQFFIFKMHNEKADCRTQMTTTIAALGSE
jgi:hypothetical protein